MLGVELATNASSASATEALSQTLDGILGFIVAANDVLVNKDSFEKLKKDMERLVPVLKELKKRNLDGSECLSKAVEILGNEVKSAKQLMSDCSKKNRVYLLLRCRAIVSQVERCSREISRALSLIPLAELGLSSDVSDEVRSLCESMGRAEFRAAVSEEKIMEKIESGIQDGNVDRSYANGLMILIAEAVGASTEKSELRKEIEEFKSEIENARLMKNLAEAIQMDQIIALLERSDVGSSPKERESRYYSKRNSLGNQLVEPLQSFICPITRDVMVDPVETSSGQTFERVAIQEWIKDGKTLCPLTMIPIEPSVLRPNKTLRQSIEEWRDRNIMIAIKTTRQKLLFEEDEEVINRLGELRELCEQRDQHREWVILEEYIQLLVQFLTGKNPEIRRRVLAVLCLLAKDSDDAKEKLLRLDNGIENIVKSLGRKVEERKLAVALLLEVSKWERAIDRIGRAQGCILFLVTMTNSNDDGDRATADAQTLLANLSLSEYNVVLMAKANYFKHLLERLSSGSEDVKLNMVTSLAEMELTDRNKEAVVEGGAMGPLLELVSTGDAEARRAALSALRNLSTVPANGLRIIRAGAERPLLDILFQCNLADLTLNGIVAATLMNLAAASRDSKLTPVTFLDSDEDVAKLFALLTSKGPDVQQSVLHTFHILSRSTSALKAKLIEYSGFPVLIQLCESKDPSVQANAMKLFCCLTEGSDETIVAEHVSQKFVETVVQIATSSSNDEDIISALGIISNLPETAPQITAWLIGAGALPAASTYLAGNRRRVTENAAGAIRRLAGSISPAEVDGNTVPALVRLLETGTGATKRNSALALARLSSQSKRLSRPVPKRGGLLMCFSGSRGELGCPVHSGVCSVGSTFCLVEAGAVEPLVRLVGEAEGASSAAMDALSSLIEGELLQCGTKVLDGADALQPIIKLLGSPSPLLQEKALVALHRMFRLVEIRQKYGMCAQMSLVDLTQSVNVRVKSMAATILAQLNVLHDQSSYFGS